MIKIGEAEYANTATRRTDVRAGRALRGRDADTGAERRDYRGARAARAANAPVSPNKVGGLDCNGLSPIQHPVKRVIQCADPRGSDEGRFEDNGRYIGHDEPSVRFVSNAAWFG